MKTLFFSLLALVMIACAPPPKPPLSATLGQPFTLAFGQTVTLSDAPIAITFDSVGEDSRCPRRVQCAWTGRAVLGFSARYNSKSAENFQLITKHSPEDNFKTVFHGYLVTMTAVQPTPETPDNPIRTQDYRVTLTVAR